MNNRENTLTADPAAVLAFNLTIVKDGSLVKLHTAAVDGSSKGNLVWMEILPT